MNRHKRLEFHLQGIVTEGSSPRETPPAAQAGGEHDSKEHS